MHHKIHVIDQHPLGLLVTFNTVWIYSGTLQAQFDFVGNGLDLARIRPAADHKQISKGARVLFKLKNREFLGFLLVAGVDGFRDLAFELVLFQLEIGVEVLQLHLKYNPSFFMYSSTFSGTNLRIGFLAATAVRIAVAEMF